MDHVLKYFPSGLRLLHIPCKGPVAHLAVYINTGTRDEDPEKNGLAHFIEHTIFKGTSKRKAYHILTRLESVGGELNAFTTKEETCIYATFIKENFHRAVELVSDIFLNSTFPDKELKKEKDVILDEINSYKDTPSEEIYDVLEEEIFKGHPLGMNILGDPAHLVAFSRDDVLEFITANYAAEQVVICTSGDLDFNRISRMVEKYFDGLSEKSNRRPRNRFDAYHPFEKNLHRTTYQAHCMIGNQAYHRNDPKRFALFLLNNILGGPAMNSRLNLAVRERHGYAYNIESVYLPYTDTGVFSIYLGTDTSNLEKSLKLVRQEMDRFRNEPLSMIRLSQAKKQLIGQIEIANESNLNYLLAAGKAFLHDHRLDGADELRMRIEAVTSDQIREAAMEVFDPAGLSRIIFQPDTDQPTL